jgi:hypothetical protein
LNAVASDVTEPGAAFEVSGGDALFVPALQPATNSKPAVTAPA